MINSVVDVDEFIIEWPGWKLADNKYGDEFDRDARIRMIRGSRKLIPFIQKYSWSLQLSLLEIGPFFNPLLTCKELANTTAPKTLLSFVENDPFAVSWLMNNDHTVFNVDLNSPALKNNLLRQITAHRHDTSFNAIILSQVLNYVSPAELFHALFPFLNNNGLLFINNVINYGIPQLFSKQRPTSNDDIIKALQQNGYIILECAVIPKEFEKEPEGRLIVVASKP